MNMSKSCVICHCVACPDEDYCPDHIEESKRLDPFDEDLTLEPVSDDDQDKYIQYFGVNENEYQQGTNRLSS